MHEFLVSILIGLSSFLGVKNIPEVYNNWNLDQSWVEKNGHWTLKASYTLKATDCESND